MKYFHIAFFIFCTVMCKAQKSGYLEVDGIIENPNKAFKTAMVTVIKNQVDTQVVQVGSDGRFTINLDYNKGYFISFNAEGLRSKSVLIDTSIPIEKKDAVSFAQFKIELLPVNAIVARPDSFPIAKIKFENAINDFGYDELLNYNLGVECVQKKQYENAIYFFTSSIDKNKNTVDSYFNRAACYRKIKKMPEACEDWKKAKELGDQESADLILKYCMEVK